MNWDNISRSDILASYVAATKIAFRLEEDMAGTFQLLCGEIPSPHDFPASQFKYGWIWCRFSFHNIISGKNENVLLPGCDVDMIRPPETADLIERVKYPEFVRDGHNVFWPSPDREDILSELDQAIEDWQSHALFLSDLRLKLSLFAQNEL